MRPSGLRCFSFCCRWGCVLYARETGRKLRRCFSISASFWIFYYGKDFFLDAALPDEVRNDKVDRAVSKIDFLTRNGLDKDMARKLARLLDDEELKHPRTVEQQKKLNAALNRLVQNLSSKNEKLAAQS